MFARWREEDVLAGIIFLGLICHGIFFAREWLIFGGLLLICRLGLWINKGKGQVRLGKVFGAGNIKGLLSPIGIFAFMIILSLIGLIQPVRSVEGWLEAWRWLVFLIAYLWGKQSAGKPEQRDIILNKILLAALVGTVISWLPGNEKIWAQAGVFEQGRFSATFGYPNAAAGFLGCQLLILLKDRNLKWFYIFVFTAGLLSTGSRAAVLMLLLFFVLLIGKRARLNRRAAPGDGFNQLFNTKTLKPKLEREIKAQRVKMLAWGAVVCLCGQTFSRWREAFSHLLAWRNTSLPERLMYYWDSFRLARSAHFFPRAGGWLAFPFIQTIPYFTLYPHSSLCQVLLNQGLAGVLILLIWSWRGMKGYFCDLKQSRDLTTLCSKTAVCYLGLHSLVDVDMSFGVLGILFWFMAGMNSK
jgi:hypothetical protein